MCMPHVVPKMGGGEAGGDREGQVVGVGGCKKDKWGKKVII